MPTPDEISAANIRLVRENQELMRFNADAISLLTELWEYYAYPGKDGVLWPGGLSLLEDLQRLLAKAKPNITTSDVLSEKQANHHPLRR